jgi:hypothetical protein
MSGLFCLRRAGHPQPGFAAAGHGLNFFNQHRTGCSRIWVTNAIENNLVIGHFVLSNQQEAKE